MHRNSLYRILCGTRRDRGDYVARYRAFVSQYKAATGAIPQETPEVTLHAAGASRRQKQQHKPAEK
jgi:hypothetical protein